MALIKITRDAWWASAEYMNKEPRNRVWAMISSGYLWNVSEFDRELGMEKYDIRGGVNEYREGENIYAKWRKQGGWEKLKRHCDE